MSENNSSSNSPVVFEGELFVSSEGFATATSSVEWDSLAPQCGTPSNGQQPKQGQGLSRWERDSLYTKFDPLLSVKKEDGVASDEQSDRLSSVFKVPLVPGSAEVQERKAMENKSSPQSEAGTSYQSADMSLCTSQLLDEGDYPSGHTSRNQSALSWDADASLYKTAVEFQCGFDVSQNETVISGNSSILKEECVGSGDGILTIDNCNNDDVHQDSSKVEPVPVSAGDSACKVLSGGMESLTLNDDGSPVTFYEAAAGAVHDEDGEDLNNMSICDDIFLKKFTERVVINTPPAKSDNIAEDDEQEEDLNGSLSVTPHSPLDSLNVTQIRVESGNNDLAEEETMLVASGDDEHEEVGLDKTDTPAINISVIEEDPVASSASSSSFESTPEFEGNPISGAHQEQLLRIQNLKAQLAKKDEEYEEYCIESDKMLARKEAVLETVVKQADLEMSGLQRKELHQQHLKLQRDQALEDLKLREADFAEIVSMYEQMKRLAIFMERNSVTMNERKEQLDKCLDEKERRNEAVAQMVRERLDSMRKDFGVKIKDLQAENIKLRGRIRLTDMGTEQKMTKIAQLESENQKLKSLCDELTATK